jgi:4-azaleucine resistance transporter AzlC
LRAPAPVEVDETTLTDVGIAAAAPAGFGATLARPFRLSLPVAMAYVPLGIAFGVLVVTSGISWYWAPISAMSIFAGSIEFLSVGLAVSGVPVSQIAVTALVVNFRHIFYGLSFPISRLRIWPQKLYGVFALTDETYGIVSAGEGSRMRGEEITALQVISHGWWVGGAFLGAVVGNLIPPSVTGFGFALTSMFLVLALDAAVARKSFGFLSLAILSSAFAKAFDRFAIHGSFLIAGLSLYVAGVTFDYWLRRAVR